MHAQGILAKTHQALPNGASLVSGYLRLTKNIALPVITAH